MDLHVCIKIDDDAVDKIARVITETVKRVAEARQVGAAQQPASLPQPAPHTGGTAAPANALATPYNAQIAQATQQPVQAVAGQHPPVAQPAPTAQPITASAATVQAAPIPTSPRTYTLDDLAGAAMTLMDRGMQAQLQDLLAGYGVEALPMLPPEQYGNFATALRGMGAQI